MSEISEFNEAVATSKEKRKSFEQIVIVLGATACIGAALWLASGPHKEAMESIRTIQNVQTTPKATPAK